MESKKIILAASVDSPADSVQKAIDRMEFSDGTIVLTEGRHHSGPLKLRSGMTLHLEKGAELIFSDDFSLYGPVKTRWEGTECYALQSLIFAENETDITISGKGIIDGSGSRWWDAYRLIRSGGSNREIKEVRDRLSPLNAGISGGSGGGGRETNFLRPSLVQFKDCENVLIKGVTLKNSPFWNTHILYSRNVRLEDVTFVNPPDAPNTDGLDIDSSEDVTVDNCLFNVGDDCLCLKSGMDDDGIQVGRPTRNVIVRSCFMNKGHGGIVIGSETSGGISRIRIENCTMSGTDRGIRVKTRRGRGGTIENIRFKNIEMVNVTAPIVMNMFYRCGADGGSLERLMSHDNLSFDEKRTPVIKNIEIKNLQATAVRSSSAFLMGLPESPISNIRIEDFKVTSREGEVFEEPAMDFFYTKAEGPNILYKYIKDIKLKNVRIDNEDQEIRKEIEC